MKIALLLLAVAGPGLYDTPSAEVWFRDAQAAHTAADAAVARHDVAAARLVLQDFILKHLPAVGMEAKDYVPVQQDLWFHLATIDLAASNINAARAEADEGLQLQRADDLFTANLLVVRGRARELLHDDRGAISDYQEAMRINEKLLHAATSTEKAP